MKLIRIAVIAVVAPLAGCTGLVSSMTARDTRWTKNSADAAALEQDYRQCRASVVPLYALDVSLMKGAAIHSAALDCLRDQKGWRRDEHGLLVPATGFN